MVQTIADSKSITSYILFYAFGVVTLVPSNFFTTATDYWMYKFRNTESNESYSSNNRTRLQAEFVADYSIVAHTNNAVFIVLTVLFLRRSSLMVRITSGLCGTILIFGLTCIFVIVNTDSWQLGFMILTLVLGCFLTGFSGILLVTIAQISTQFPSHYFAVYLSGQSICGILAALVQIFALSLDKSPTINAIVYFGSGLFFVFLTLITFLVNLKKSHFFIYHFNKKVEEKHLNVNKKKILSIFRKLKLYMLALFLTVGSTVMIHPGVTSLVKSVNEGSRWDDVYFVPVITFLIYCCCDYVGREAAMFLKKPSNDIAILLLSVLRLVFIPLVMLCNAQPRHHLSVIFDENYIYLIIIIAFSLSHGYMFNLATIPMAQIPDEEEKPVAVFSIMIIMIVSLIPCSFVANGLINAL